MRFRLITGFIVIGLTAAFVVQGPQLRSFYDTSSSRTKRAAVRPSSITSPRPAPKQRTTNAVLQAEPLRRQEGDTRGAALLLEDVTVFRGPAPILQDLTWRVEPKTKWGLVGANGAGKSTLLKAIVGELEYDGNILVQNFADVGYLQQTAVAGSTRTVYEEACSEMKVINEIKAAMDRAAELGDDEAMMRATMQFEANDGYKQEQKVDNVLRGLGFRDDYHVTRCHELSGGWQMRVAFARQLLSDAKLSLLDEPSNHLDASARTWLAKYLSSYRGEGALVLVTHDVELLQSVDHIAEIIPGSAGLQVYKSCTYDQYLEQKQERAAAAITAYERNQEEAAKLQSFVDRFGASATKAASAQSRVKQIERMREKGLLDAPAEAIVAERFRPVMTLPKPPKAFGEVLLSLHDADLGYKTGQPLVKGVSIEVSKGMKVLIRGPNGSGKSTLLHSIRGSLPLLSGERHENPKLSLGMFTQDLAQELDPMAVALDIVTAYAREFNAAAVSNQQARGALGRLGLTGEKALRRLVDLSGGEKARVALTMFALRASNVYILDEASNHLDSEW
jgi:ATP-binding cassette, subfamily F, member 3